MRARNIKPGFFTNEELGECSPWARLCFIGLWMLADREGRLEDRPKRIKGEIFRFDSIEVDPLLDELQHHGFIDRYVVDGFHAIQILRFDAHQTPHYTEKESAIKARQLQELLRLDGPDDPGGTPPSSTADSGRTPRIPRASRGGHYPLNPDSLNPDSPIQKAKSLASADRARGSGENPEDERDDPPEANGHGRTPAGEACLAMRRAGLSSTNPGDPRLLALLEQGATVDELAGIAAEAAEATPPKGWAWVLKVVEARRNEARDIRLAPAEKPKPWHETRDGVNSMACRLAYDAWDGIEGWERYRARVIAAAQQQGAEA